MSAATVVNVRFALQASSRSHSVFQLMVEQRASEVSLLMVCAVGYIARALPDVVGTNERRC